MKSSDTSPNFLHLETGFLVAILLASTVYSDTVQFLADQNTTDVAGFKFLDGEFMGRADYAAMTLDATGTGGVSFVKLFTKSNERFNVSVYIPGREGVDIISVAAIEKYSDDGSDPIFTKVTWDYVVDQGLVINVNEFNTLEVWADESLLITSTGDLTNLYIHQPDDLKGDADSSVTLFCIQGNEEITGASQSSGGNKGIVVEAIATPSMWGRQFVVPQIPSFMRGHTVKVMAWLPFVTFHIKINGGETQTYRFNNFDPMMFELPPTETAVIWSDEALYVTQYTWGGIGDNVGPSSLTVFDIRLGYKSFVFSVDVAYNNYISMGAKKKHLNAIYDYSSSQRLNQKSNSMEHFLPDGDKWVTCVDGPYSGTSVTIEAVDTVNEKGNVFFPKFTVSLYAICKSSVCTGATMVDLAISGSVTGVGVSADQVEFREEVLKNTTMPDPETSTVPGETSSTARPTTASGTSPRTDAPITSSSAPTPSTAQSSSSSPGPTTSPDPQNIPETDCPCVKVSGVPAAGDRDDLVGFFLRLYGSTNNTELGIEDAANILVHKNRQVYQHENCGLFLFFHPWPANYWLFGPEVGQSRGFLLNFDKQMNIESVTQPWKILNPSTNVWEFNNQIKTECACKDFPCAALQLTTESAYEFSGIFYIHGLTNNRPVYKHAQQNMFLSYYKQKIDASCSGYEESFWVVGSEVGVSGGLAFSPDFAKNPAAIEAPWYVDNAGWREESALSVSCLS